MMSEDVESQADDEKSQPWSFRTRLILYCIAGLLCFGLAVWLTTPKPSPSDDWQVNAGMPEFGHGEGRGHAFAVEEISAEANDQSMSGLVVSIPPPTDNKEN